jgi:hypothetical protein
MVLVNSEFLNTTHGKISCSSCHGGNPGASDKNNAHLDLVADPSSQADTYCSSCHARAVKVFSASLHYNQNGYYNLFAKRAGFDLRQNPSLQSHFDAECGKCHTTCGQCHISRPGSVKGGFISGHDFKFPSMTNNCTACHGSRVGAEYLGENQGLKGDVHWLPNARRCDFCHTSGELHGNGTYLVTRYDDNNILRPDCEDCHEGEKTANIYHQQHWASAETDTSLSLLSCQVCHAQDYKNCNACHTGGSGITGSSYMTYKIGRNYQKSNKKPYDYITVRHIPVAPDTYTSWGVTDLADFFTEPTWKYTTPHNIQRWTTRTDTTGGVVNCWSKCHNNENQELTTYLRSSDLANYEIDANQKVLMPTN